MTLSSQPDKADIKIYFCGLAVDTEKENIKKKKIKKKTPDLQLEQKHCTGQDFY